MNQDKGRKLSAWEILHRRYVKGDPEREMSLQTERANAEVAQLIYDLRKDAGLTQEALASLIGTTQSVVSRLEDADYEGHSLSMLNRIAKALNRRLTVLTTPEKTEEAEVNLWVIEIWAADYAKWLPIQRSCPPEMTRERARTALREYKAKIVHGTTVKVSAIRPYYHIRKYERKENRHGAPTVHREQDAADRRRA